MTGLATLHQQIRIWNRESALHFHAIRSKYLRADSRHNIVFVKCKGAQKYGHRIVLGILFASGFGFFCGFLSWYHLPCICNSLELEPSCCMVFATFWHGHFALCMVFATFGHVRLPFCMVFVTFWHVNLSFALYLLHFGTSNVHVGLLRVL